MDDDLAVRVLGPVEVVRAGAVIPVGGPKPQLLLSLLVARRNSVVPSSTL